MQRACNPLCVLQVATRVARVALDAPSIFGQKITAAVCREGIVGWVVAEQQLVDQRAAERKGAEQQGAPRHSIAAAASRPGGGPWKRWANGDVWRRLWTAPGVLLPVLTLATGSSVFEEVAYRGVLLHGLMRLKLGPVGPMGPRLAAFLSSAAFGYAHMGNEQGLKHQCIYAGWTFVAGLICSAAYIGTRGGLVVPTLLHFVNNAVVFGVSAHKVARKLLAQHASYVELNDRVATEANAAARARAAAGRGSGPAAGASSMVDSSRLVLGDGVRMRRVDIGALNSRLR